MAVIVEGVRTGGLRSTNVQISNGRLRTVKLSASGVSLPDSLTPWTPLGARLSYRARRVLN